MSRKRRQRSTAIRKRIEKKQREDKKAAIRAGKRSGKEDETPLTMRVDREVAAACAAEIRALAGRLAAAEQGQIRGWTTHDLGPDGRGLSWLADALATACEGDTGSMVELAVLRVAQGTLLDKLNAIELAASGLGLDWDVGFLALSRAISHAEEPPEVEEDEDEDDDDDGDDDGDDESGESDVD